MTFYFKNGPCGQAELETAEWERIFAEAKELGIAMILLAGGEPFMRSDVIAAAAKYPETIRRLCIVRAERYCQQSVIIIFKI